MLRTESSDAARYCARRFSSDDCRDSSNVVSKGAVYRRLKSISGKSIHHLFLPVFEESAAASTLLPQAIYNYKISDHTSHTYPIPYTARICSFACNLSRSRLMATESAFSSTYTAPSIQMRSIKVSRGTVIPTCCTRSARSFCSGFT